MVKLLLDNKSPLNATDVANYTALHHGMIWLLLPPFLSRVYSYISHGQLADKQHEQQSQKATAIRRLYYSKRELKWTS